MQTARHLLQRFLLMTVLMPLSLEVKSQRANIPSLYVDAFKKAKLDEKYQLQGWLKTPFLQADFNGDGIPDIAALVTEKKSHKKGIIVIHGGGIQCFVFGAGTPLGKPGFDAHDNLKWVAGWKVNKNKFVNETLFDNGDIIGSKKVNIKFPGLSVWDLMDGQPNTGGTIYWNGRKYAWIHEGE